MQQPLFLFPGETTCLQGDPRNQAVIVDAKLPTYTEIPPTQMQVKRKTNCSAWDWHGRVGGGGKLVVGPTRKLIGVEHIRPPPSEARGAIHY